MNPEQLSFLKSSSQDVFYFFYFLKKIVFLLGWPINFKDLEMEKEKRKETDDFLQKSHLECLVGAEHRCDFMTCVRATNSAQLAHQTLAGFAIMRHLFSVFGAHQTLQRRQNEAGWSTSQPGRTHNVRRGRSGGKKKRKPVITGSPRLVTALYGNRPKLQQRWKFGNQSSRLWPSRVCEAKGSGRKIVRCAFPSPIAVTKRGGLYDLTALSSRAQGRIWI